LVVSGGNYAFTLAVVHLLRPAEFARFSASQGLLLVLGNGCMAAIPWAIARHVALSQGRRTKQEALHFGLLAAATQGLIAGPVAGVVLAVTANLAVGIVTGFAALALSLVAAPVGFLQGQGRVGMIANARIIEWLVRVGVGLVALLVVRRTASAALVGYGCGSVILVAVCLIACREGFPLRRGAAAVERALVRESLRLGGIQLALAMLGALDTVSALASHFSGPVAGGYQAAALLGRVPLFLSTAISLAAYTHLARAREGRDVETQLTHALALYAIVTVPCVLICWTVPSSVLHVLFPARYADIKQILRYTSMSGAAVGWMDIISTAHQARGRYRPALAILGVAAVLQPVLLVVAGRGFGIWAFTATLVGVSAIGAIALTVDARRWIRLRVPARVWITVAGMAVMMAFAGNSAAPWAMSAALVCALALSLLRSTIRSDSPVAGGSASH
jgi:O-antigen/teichoic acid export membrane protein